MASKQKQQWNKKREKVVLRIEVQCTLNLKIETWKTQQKICIAKFSASKQFSKNEIKKD